MVTRFVGPEPAPCKNTGMAAILNGLRPRRPAFGQTLSSSSARDVTGLKGIRGAVGRMVARGDVSAVTDSRDEIQQHVTPRLFQEKIGAHMPEADPTERPVREVLKDAGSHLGFTVKTEVEASESAYVDLVWFDSRFPIPSKNFKMRYALVLPVVGFEIEKHTGLNAKHVKGSVSNLNNLGAQLGVIVIGDANITSLQSRPPHDGKERDEVKKVLCERVYRWVYAEAQPTVRIIVMFEDDVRKWAKWVQANAQSESLVRTTEVLKLKAAI